MKAKFGDGPYDQMELNVQVGVDHLFLPVTITPDFSVGDPIAYRCQAKYRLVQANDVEARYQFEGISR